MEDEASMLERRIKEMQEKIEANERTLAAEKAAEHDFFNAAFISDGKKYRWEVNPEGKHVPVEESLTDADVAAILDALDKEDFRLSEDIRLKTEELKRLEAELATQA